MTAQEAYKIVSGGNSLLKVRGCLDFGKFFAFVLAPMNIPDDEDYFFGTEATAVDKKTGKVFYYDLTSDLDAYEKAKKVEIETIFDKVL